MYSFSLAGLLVVAGLANLLSKASERSYHRSRELERLEGLGTEIINAPLDASTLPDLLQQYVPGTFPDCQIEIRLFPDTILLPGSADWPPISQAGWEWLQSQAKPEISYFLRGSRRPWEDRPSSRSLILAPVFSIDSGELIGGIGVTFRWWPPKIIPWPWLRKKLLKSWRWQAKSRQA